MAWNRPCYYIEDFKCRIRDGDGHLNVLFFH